MSTLGRMSLTGHAIYESILTSVAPHAPPPQSKSGRLVLQANSRVHAHLCFSPWHMLNLKYFGKNDKNTYCDKPDNLKDICERGH